jgi:thiamine monophosphate synthase
VLPPRFLAITPPTGSPDPQLIDLWLDAGIRPAQVALLLREPGVAPMALLGAQGRLAPLLARARQHGLRVLLSVDPEYLARAHEFVREGAVAGLHLRGRPDPGAPARPRVDGRSAHRDDLSDPRRCNLPAAYWTFAPVFDSSDGSKSGVGVEPLAQACSLLAAPVLALGGISGKRARACFAAGAFGLAGIGCFFGAPGRVAHDAGAFAAALQGVLATTN